MSFQPIYCTEVPSWADPELSAALETIAAAPESSEVGEAEWNAVLDRILAMTLATRKAEERGSPSRYARRGWMQIDKTAFNIPGGRPFSFEPKQPPAAPTKLLFPVVLHRPAGTWEAPPLMLDAILARPEVRRLYETAPWPGEPRESVISILSRVDPLDPLAAEAAEFIREVIAGDAINGERYLAQSILAALELGRSMGRAEALAEAAGPIRQGIQMEQPNHGKGADPFSSRIDQILAETPHAKPKQIMAALRIREHQDAGKPHPWLKSGDLFSDDPAIDKLLTYYSPKEETEKRADKAWLDNRVKKRRAALGKE